MKYMLGFLERFLHQLQELGGTGERARHMSVRTDASSVEEVRGS